jgi:hypothetical protein
MKLFSLENKSSLLVWSIVLGFVLNFLINIIVLRNSCKGSAACFGDYGFPFKSPADTNAFGIFLDINTVIWIAAVFIILKFAKNFKKKKYQVQAG